MNNVSDVATESNPELGAGPGSWGTASTEAVTTTSALAGTYTTALAYDSAERLVAQTFDSVVSGTLRKGAAFITRQAPGVGSNHGGGIEVVVNPGGFEPEIP